MSKYSVTGPRWEKVRQQVKSRAGGMCENLCGNEGNEGDHIIPLALGGEPYELSNVRWLCKPCNTRKGSRMNEDRRQTWKHAEWFKD